jgi:hypothetical protein
MPAWLFAWMDAMWDATPFAFCRALVDGIRVLC